MIQEEFNVYKHLFPIYRCSGLSDFLTHKHDIIPAKYILPRQTPCNDVALVLVEGQFYFTQQTKWKGTLSDFASFIPVKLFSRKNATFLNQKVPRHQSNLDKVAFFYRPEDKTAWLHNYVAEQHIVSERKKDFSLEGLLTWPQGVISPQLLK